MTLYRNKCGCCGVSFHLQEETHICPNCDQLMILRLFGYLPNSYMNVCGECGGEFIGAKGSSRCIECAVKAFNEQAEGE